MEVNEILTQIRENKYNTQTQVANKLKIAQSTYAEYESGQTTIPLEKLCNFAVIYNIRLDYILGLSKIKEPFSKMQKFDINIMANNLKQLRKNNNLTQKELGKKLSYSDAIISKQENAKHIMTYPALIKLSKIYKVPTDFIVGITK